PPGPMPPPPATPPASAPFSQRLPQEVPVQRQVGDELLELVVFLPELPELPHLGNAQAPEPLLPPVEGRLTHPELPADLLDRGPGLRLAEGHRDLLRAVPAGLHRPPLLGCGPDCRSNRRVGVAQDSGSSARRRVHRLRAMPLASRWDWLGPRCCRCPTQSLWRSP